MQVCCDLCRTLRQALHTALCHSRPTLAILTLMYEGQTETRSEKQTHTKSHCDDHPLLKYIQTQKGDQRKHACPLRQCHYWGEGAYLEVTPACA